MGKFLIQFGVEKSMFFVSVTVVASVLFISIYNKIVVKSITEISFLPRELYERGVDVAFLFAEIKVV